MPDPVSIALAVVTFATVFKDVIELAQKIKGSIDKPGQNKKRLHDLTDDMLQGLIDLESYYNGRERVLDGSAELQDALDGLQTEMRRVLELCLIAFPEPTGGRIAAAKADFKAWKKRNDIEADIIRLKERVHGCQLRFTTIASARIEHTSAQIKIALLVFNNEQRERLSRMENMVARLLVDTQVDCTRAREFKPLSDICYGDIEQQYLRLQVKRIVDSLEKLAASGSFTAEEPEGIYLLPTTMCYFAVPLTGDPVAQHKEVVMNALRILRLLQDDRANLSIQNGALDMLGLSCALHDLGMSEEAESTCTWAASLYRTLVRGHANSFLPYLAAALYNLAVYRVCIGDPEGSLTASQNCIAIYRFLCDTEIRRDYLVDLARALGVLATALLVARRSDEALAAAEESVTILKDVTAELLAVELLIASCNLGSGSEERNGEDEDMVDLGLAEEGGENMDHIDEISMLGYHLGVELRSLSDCLADLDRYSDAYDAAKEALDIFRTISKKYPGTFDGMLADSLWDSSHRLSVMDQPSEALPLLEEAVPIYRILAQKGPTTFVLIRSLCKFATLLRKIGREDDALAAGDEAVRSWRSLVVYRSDFALHRPERLQVVCSYLQDLGRNEEAIALSREAVDACRNLAKGDPVVYSSHLALGLAALAHSFYATQQYSKGIEAGKEAVDLYRTLSEGQVDLKDRFLEALEALWFALEDAEHLEDLIAVGTDVISVYRTHAEDDPTKFSPGLAEALLNHSYYLFRNGQYLDALIASEEAVNLYRSFEGPDSACSFVNAANSFAIRLYDVGRVEQAIEICQEAITVCRDIIDDHPRTTSTLISLLANLSDCFRSRGQFNEALILNEEAVSLSRSVASEKPAELAFELRELSMSLLNAGRSQDALRVSEEAVEMCRKLPQSQDVSSALAYSLDSLSNCLADAGREEDALVAVEEAVTLYRQIAPNYRERSGCLDCNIADAIYDLAARLAAAGRPADALANMRDAASMYRTVVTTRVVHLPKFATVVHSLSVQLWQAGHHDEAIDSWKEEVTIRRRLASTNIDLTPMLHDALWKLSARLSQVNRLEEASVAGLEASKVRDEYPGVFEHLPPTLLDGLDTAVEEGNERDDDVVDFKLEEPDASKIDRMLYIYIAWIIARLKAAIVVPLYFIFRLFFTTDYYLT